MTEQSEEVYESEYGNEYRKDTEMSAQIKGQDSVRWFKHRTIEDECIAVNTETKVWNEPFGRRKKMDDAVRRILLFKDMKQTEHKGEIDATTKLNQAYIN